MNTVSYDLLNNENTGNKTDYRSLPLREVYNELFPLNNIYIIILKLSRVKCFLLEYNTY